jgi:fibronectin-binding autotransporter adhesin
MNDNQVWFPRRARAGATQQLSGGRTRPRASARLRARPEVFVLEDRRLMATFVVSNPTDSLTDGVPSPNTLRWAVDQANLAGQPNDPSVIAFSLGGGPTTISLTQGPLELSNSAVPVTIMGPSSGSLAVSGNGASGIFQIDPGVQATISGVELEHGRSSYGGAIRNQGDLTVLGCLFLSNQAPGIDINYPQYNVTRTGPGYGGAIDNSGTLSLTGCTLSGNSANLGGAIAESVSDGGSISLSLKDCTLSDNSAVELTFFNIEGLGGAIFSGNVNGQSTVSLTGCNISDNSGVIEGGGIDCMTSNGSTTLSLVDCTLSDNSIGGNGGALSDDDGTLSMVGCTLSGNTAGGSGGGAYITGTGTLAGSTLSGNSAGGSGGGAYIVGTGTLTGCTLNGNIAGGSGGGANIVGTGTLIGCAVSGNSASGSGGGGIYNQGSIELDGCTVSGNAAKTASGGGINHGSGTLSMTDCTVSGNTATTAGGIFNHGYYNVNRSYYGYFNLLVTEPGVGSATLTGCTISGNSASQGGGGVVNATGTLSMTECTVSGNIAATGGGILNRAYYNSNQVRSIPYYDYAYTVAVTQPGADSAILTGCTISGNSASQGGGGVDNVLLQPGAGSAQAALADTIVAGNVGAGSGADDINGNDAADVTGSFNLIGTGGSGGLTAAGHNLLNVANPGLTPLGDFGGPTETLGLEPNSPAIHAGVAVTGVTTDQRGFPLDSPPDIGAFQSHPGPLVVDTAIDGLGSGPGQLSLRQAVNLADVLNGGDAITFDRTAFAKAKTITLTDGPLEISNTTGPISITGTSANRLAISGGEISGVFTVDVRSSAILSNLTITGGVTAGNGGGLLNQGTTTLANVVVAGNVASGEGGGLFNSGSLFASNLAVAGNSATDGGGLDNAGTAVIVASSIDSNVVSSVGGGIFNTGALALSLSDLSANSAALAGGGLFNEGTAALVFCTVDDNAASVGGGVYADPSGQPVVLIGTEFNRNKGGNVFGCVIQL